MTSNSSLAHAIEKDVLTCVLCKKVFQSPKILECLHTFCEACLEKVIIFTSVDNFKFPCPTCRAECYAPPDRAKGIKDNVFYEKLKRLVQERQNTDEQPVCGLCSEDAITVPATVRCLDCKDFLCGNCEKIHRKIKSSQRHQLFAVEDLGGEAYQRELFRHELSFCPKHEETVQEFYCVKCKQPVCIRCKILSHDDHKCVQIEIAAQTQVKEIQDLLQKLATQRERYESTQASLGDVETGLDHQQRDVQFRVDHQRQVLLSRIDQYAKDIGNEIDEKFEAEEKHVEAASENVDNMLMAIDGISQISHRLTKDASPAEIVNMKVQCATKIQAILEKSPPTVPEIPKLCFKFSPTTNELLKGGFGYLYLDDGRPSMLNKIRIPLLSRKKERLYSLDSSTSGDIIISTFCEKDPALNRIFILDREARAVKQKFGVPNMSSMTYLAASVTSHHKECLVVTDPKQGMIYVFDTAGILISSLICPKALAVTANSKNQPIIQTHGHQDDRIHRLNLSGGVIKSFSDGNAGDDKGVVQLKQLSCSKSNGDILVSDPMNACVRSYSQEGELKFTYTPQGAGSTPSEPFVPFGICTNEKGDIFVTDTNNKTIHRLSSKGEFKELVLTKADGLSSEPMGVVVSGNGQLVVGLQDGWVKVYSYR